jgi:hypothetical protein
MLWASGLCVPGNEKLAFPSTEIGQRRRKGPLFGSLLLNVLCSHPAYLRCCGDLAPGLQQPPQPWRSSTGPTRRSYDPPRCLAPWTRHGIQAFGSASGNGTFLFSVDGSPLTNAAAATPTALLDDSSLAFGMHSAVLCNLHGITSVSRAMPKAKRPSSVHPDRPRPFLRLLTKCL